MVKIIKSDWSVLVEAEAEGRAASMTNIVLPNRTPWNEELSMYFKEQMPKYLGSFDEVESEDVLCAMNEYMQEKKITKFKQPFDFPYTEGSEIYLIPITENLQLKLLVVDEYHGGGDYTKYIDMSYFVINDNTTREDVDELIAAVKQFTIF